MTALKARPHSAKKRLDVLLFERGLVESRQKAQAVILAGEVRVNGQRAEKPGVIFSSDAQIEITARGSRYASRLICWFWLTSPTLLRPGAPAAGFDEYRNLMQLVENLRACADALDPHIPRQLALVGAGGD